MQKEHYSTSVKGASRSSHLKRVGNSLSQEKNAQPREIRLEQSYLLMKVIDVTSISGFTLNLILIYRI